MTEFVFDPATGQPTTTWPAPGAPASSYRDASGQWAPSDTPCDAHDEPFEVGDEPPTTGPVPGNIVTGGPVPGPLSRSRL
jgi:hypothetical protein